MKNNLKNILINVHSELIKYSFASMWYTKIVNEFHFSRMKDEEARDILYQYRLNFSPESIISQIQKNFQNRKVIFFGAGPNLSAHLELFAPNILTNRLNFFLVSADGASNGLVSKKIDPDLIISDLDGLTSNQLNYFLSKNIPILIHAHGDNIIQIKENQTLIKKYANIIGTTQVDSRFPIINPGGFTDGDRGIFFCHHLTDLDSKFILLGYEFNDTIGHFSKPNYKKNQAMHEIKKKKLQFCKEMIDFISKEHKRCIYIFDASLEINCIIKHEFEIT